jgi:hypothetical protein
MYFFALFLVFLYFKIARVHKKEEALSLGVTVQHIIVAICAFVLFGYGFAHYSILEVLLLSFVFFIAAALMVTAVQLGIFVDGKPVLGISKVYKFMPLLTLLIALITLFS